LVASTQIRRYHDDAERISEDNSEPSSLGPLSEIDDKEVELIVGD